MPRRNALAAALRGLTRAQRAGVLLGLALRLAEADWRYREGGERWQEALRRVKSCPSRRV